jgi:hypothetical protein
VLLVAMLFVCVAVGTTMADHATYTVANQNPDPTIETSFTLDFGLAGETVGDITKTDIVMRFSFEGSSPTSRFLAYDQDVQALTLPGGISTGPLKIEIVESKSAGFVFDPATGIGEFTTDDVYAVHFAGDLSPFGIESPFVLPSQSTGQMIFDEGSTERGRIEMVWAGTGTIGPDPDTAIPFEYTCTVRTVFEIPNDADFDASESVDLNDFGFMQRCFSGVGATFGLPVCEMADFDLDGDVDLDDFAVFRQNEDTQ